MSDERKPASRAKGPRTPRGKPDGKRPPKPGFGRRPDRPGGEKRAGRDDKGAPPRAERPAREDRAGEGRRPGRTERIADASSGAARQPRKSAFSTGKTSSGSARPASSGRSFDKDPSQGDNDTGERIAKRLARAGISSRRDAEALIAAGRVRVNGKSLTSPAFNVRRSDIIELDGAEIPAIERTRLFLFHKPAGLVTTNRDPEGRRTVFDILPKELPRLMTVGRLDINTEGLLLLTNDGGLARVLELPSTGWLRRYRVRVHGKVDAAALEGLKEGIAVGGVFYGAVEASLDREQGSNAWLTIGLREGKNREVKNILGALGLEVSRLIRISYGPFQLGELAEGAVMELKGRTLRDQLGQRLVEESGADFSAPVATPFSNSPVQREREAVPESVERPKARRDGDRGSIGEGGLVKNRKRQREQRREDALGRLQTSRPERPKGFKQERGGKPGEREKRRDEPPRSRSSNVWMAPGARPGGKKGERSEVDAGGSGRTERGDSRPAKADARKSGLRKDFDRKPRSDGGPSGKGGPRKPRRDR